MQIAMEFFFLPEFPDFCRKNLRQKVLCNGALEVRYSNFLYLHGGSLFRTCKFPIPGGSLFRTCKFPIPRGSLFRTCKLPGGSLFRTRKFPIPGGSLIRKWNRVRYSEGSLLFRKLNISGENPKGGGGGWGIYFIFGLTNLISFSE